MNDVALAPSIASVSLAAWESDPDGFAEKLGRSFEEYGFAIIADHGIPDSLIEEADALATAFFALADEVTRRYHVPGAGGARGYTPFGIETAKGHKAHDLKEFWHVGRELPPGHPFRGHMPDNIWPAEVPSFRDTFLELYDTFDRTDSELVVMAFAHDSRTVGNAATEIVKYYLQLHYGIKKDYRMPELLQRGNFYQND